MWRRPKRADEVYARIVYRTAVLCFTETIRVGARESISPPGPGTSPSFPALLAVLKTAGALLRYRRDQCADSLEVVDPSVLIAMFVPESGGGQGLAGGYRRFFAALPGRWPGKSIGFLAVDAVARAQVAMTVRGRPRSEHRGSPGRLLDGTSWSGQMR